jgi:uncharacterized protein GlcG (DUF336 family)
MWNILFLVGLLILGSTPAFADEKSKDDGKDLLFFSKSLSVESASKAAWGALRECRRRGYSVAVAVVDRGGVLQTLLRDRFAGPHTSETAIRKAWTANSFRQATGELAASLKEGRAPTQIQHIPGALLLGGGIPIDAQGEFFGGIGVSGAPSGESERESIDEECARAGVNLIKEAIEFGE